VGASLADRGPFVALAAGVGAGAALGLTNGALIA
jgi:hypothetical protein